MNAYAEMKKRHQEEVNALPMYWAFSDEQFDQQLKELGLTRNDTGKLCKTFGGGFCLASDAQMIADILDADNFQGADFWAADHPPVKQIDAQEKINWFELFLSRMRDYSDGEVWGIGDELMCKTEAIADAMCDLLFQLYAAQGEEVVFHTGYYDPAEDARSCEEDRCTGWWYVDCD